MAPDATLHQELWSRLEATGWPLPLGGLPPGTALVGGAVRDGLIGRLGARPDLDLVVPGDGVALAGELARRLGGTAVVLDRERAIGRLVLQGWTIDLAQLLAGSLEADLQRRDYTINALALRLPLGGEPLVLLDPLGGLGDLRQGRLRAIAEANLLDDPLRLLRGLRLAAELEFALTDQTWAWIRRHRARLGSVAGERVLAELQRLVGCADGARGVELLQRSGLLEAWEPGATAIFPSGRGRSPHTPEEARLRGLTEEESRAALPLARLADLLDEEGLRSLHASNRLLRRCRQLRRWRRRLASLGPADGDLAALPEAEQLELHRQLESDLPALLLELPPAQAAAALRRWRDPNDPLFHARPPLDGEDLQKLLGLSPGRRLGLLLEHLKAERAFGRLPLEDPQHGASLRAARLWLEAPNDPRRD